MFLVGRSGLCCVANVEGMLRCANNDMVGSGDGSDLALTLAWLVCVRVYGEGCVCAMVSKACE